MSVNKRTGSPYWYIQFQYNGQNYIKSSKSTDKKLALKMETQWRSQLIEEQQLGVKPALPIKDAFQQYSDSKRDLVSAYSVVLWCDRLVEYWSAKQYIHEVTTVDIERYRAMLAGASYSPNTIMHAISYVSGAIKYSKRMGYRVADVEMPTFRLPKTRLRYMSHEEEQRLLNCLDPNSRLVWSDSSYIDHSPQSKLKVHDLHDMIIVLIDTGARHTEVSTLRWDAVNLDDGTIKLWRPKVQNQSVLYMSHRVHAVLSRRKKVAKGPYIFASRDGGPRKYDPNPFRRAFNRAGLLDCSAHTLRHTHATRLIQNGLNLYEVKEILGHADIKTTMRYAHLEQAKVSQKATDVINLLQQNQHQQPQ